MKGCIVRLLPENIHYELIQNLGIPPEALVLEVDESMDAEEVLIEFSQSHDILHDGGIEDGKCRRYWVDENLEILETPEDAPTLAPPDTPNGYIEVPMEPNDPVPYVIPPPAPRPIGYAARRRSVWLDDFMR